jgi:hypothetical protein
LPAQLTHAFAARGGLFSDGGEVIVPRGTPP